MQPDLFILCGLLNNLLEDENYLSLIGPSFHSKNSTMKKIFLFFVICILHSGAGTAQTPYYLFDTDSLKGFDEEAARRSALSEQFFGSEFKIRMYRLKREFINNKYGLVTKNQLYATGNYHAESNRASSAASCLNEDFEVSPAGIVTSSAQVLGWTITGGYNGYVGSGSPATLQAAFPGGLAGANSCNLLGCCPMPPNAEVIDCAPGGYVDVGIGSQYQIFSVFGTGTVAGATAANPHISGGLAGTKVIRLNNMLNGDYSITKLSKTIFVSPANVLFQYAFISLMAPGHGCCDAGTMSVRLNNTSVNPPMPVCGAFSMPAPSTACTASTGIAFYNAGTGTPYNPGTYWNIYHHWKVFNIDLSAYLGQSVTIEVIVSDCNAGGHFGYLYFDAQCGPMNIRVDQTDFSITNSIHHIICDSIASLSAPENLPPYQWAGPGGFNSNSAATNASVSGVYTLTFGQSTFCSPITKTLSLVFSQTTGTITTSSPVLCLGGAAILTAVGMNNCIWNNGSTTPSIFISPTVTTNYFVSGISQNGCPISAVITQTVEDCTSIGAISSAEKGIFLYPNPNYGEFTLSLEKEIRNAGLQIENTLGQIVHTQAIRQGKNTIRIKNLPSGVYYYSIFENEKRVSTGKFKVE